MSPRITITSTAPVCPISRDQAVPGMAGQHLPFVPRALDMPSALAAANALIQALLPRAGLSAPNNSGFLPGFGSKLGQNTPTQDGGQPKKKQRRWTEKARRTCEIKYYHMLDDDKKDPDNWVLVERITYIKWHDRLMQVDFEIDWPYNPQDHYEENSEFISGDVGRSATDIPFESVQ